MANPKTISTGASRFLSSAGFMASGAGATLLALEQWAPGGVLSLNALALWGLGRVFRAKAPAVPLLGPSPADYDRLPAVVATPALAAVQELEKDLDLGSSFDEPELSEGLTSEDAFAEAQDWIDLQELAGWKKAEDAIAKLQELVDRGASLSELNDRELTLFGCACFAGAPPAVLAWFESQGVDIAGEFAVLDRLLQENENPSLAVVEFLLERGANPDGNPAIGLEAASSLLEVALNEDLDPAFIKALLAKGASDIYCDGEDKTLLAHAIYLERPLATVDLLAQAFDVNAFSGQALRVASEEGNPACVFELLLSRGANPLLRDEDNDTIVALSLIEDEEFDLLKQVLEYQDSRGRQRVLGMACASLSHSDWTKLEAWVDLLDQGSQSERLLSSIGDASTESGRRLLVQAVNKGEVLEALRALVPLSETDYRSAVAAIPASSNKTNVLLLAGRRRSPKALREAFDSLACVLG